MANLGFIGLGSLGSRIAQRLHEAGHSLTVWNRTKAKADPLLAAGMAWADSPAAVAAAADITFSMVRDTEALYDVASGPDGILSALAPGKIYVDMTTANPAAERDLARQVAKLGAQMLDAPVSGSVITLLQGKMAVMVGGDQAVFEQVKPVLLAIGPTVLHVGPTGHAMALKIATNMNVMIQILALAEGVVLAERYGVPREKSLELMTNSAIASPLVKYRGPYFSEMPSGDSDGVPTWFSVDMAQKDLLIAQELGRELGVALPLTTNTNEILTAARGLGLADRDFAIVHKVLEHMSGMAGA